MADAATGTIGPKITSGMPARYEFREGRRTRRGVGHAGLLQLFTIIMADAGYERGPTI